MLKQLEAAFAACDTICGAVQHNQVLSQPGMQDFATVDVFTRQYTAILTSLETLDGLPDGLFSHLAGVHTGAVSHADAWGASYHVVVIKVARKCIELGLGGAVQVELGPEGRRYDVGKRALDTHDWNSHSVSWTQSAQIASISAGQAIESLLCTLHGVLASVRFARFYIRNDFATARS